MEFSSIHEFESLWESGAAPPNLVEFFEQHPSQAVAERLAILLFDQQRRWRTDAPLTVEAYLEQFSDFPGISDQKLQLVVGEFEARQKCDTVPSIAEYTSRFSDLGDSLGSALLHLVGPNQDAKPASPASEASHTVVNRAQLDDLCESFEQAWRNDSTPPRIETYVDQCDVAIQSLALRELIEIDIWWRRKNGEDPQENDYRARFQDGIVVVREAFENKTETPFSAGSLETSADAEPRADEHVTEDVFQKSKSQRLGSYSIPLGGSKHLERYGYRVLDQIGSGGMGVVFKAEHIATKELVALKTLKYITAPTLYRFKKEFRLVARLFHPNLVNLRELISNEDTTFLTMDLLVGMDLQTLLKNKRALSANQMNFVSPGTTASESADAEHRPLLSQIATGIGALHTAGVLHRDIKPGNVFVTEPGNAVFVRRQLALLFSDN